MPPSSFLDTCREQLQEAKAAHAAEERRWQAEQQALQRKVAQLQTLAEEGMRCMG